MLFALGGLQGALGWYMVKSGLVDRPDVSQYRLSAHLGLAAFIYGYMLWVALGLLRPRIAAEGALSRYCFAVLCLVFATLVSGGFVAGLDAGFAYNTFPLMQGQWIPDGLWLMQPFYRNLFENLITVQFMHRVLALASLLAVGLLWLAARRSALPTQRTPGLPLALGRLRLADHARHLDSRLRRAATPGFGPSGGGAAAPDDGYLGAVRDGRSRAQISICVPSSITRFVGILKKSIALPALRDIVMKIFSRHRAMPGLTVGIMVSRLRKNEVSS